MHTSTVSSHRFPIGLRFGRPGRHPSPWRGSCHCSRASNCPSVSCPTPHPKTDILGRGRRVGALSAQASPGEVKRRCKSGRSPTHVQLHHQRQAHIDLHAGPDQGPCTTGECEREKENCRPDASRGTQLQKQQAWRIPRQPCVVAVQESGSEDGGVVVRLAITYEILPSDKG
jgi:hypothetical protein